MTEPDWVFPFYGMSVGDSFFIPTLKPSAVLYAAMEAAKVDKIKVKAFITTHEGYMGVRVWRIG